MTDTTTSDATQADADAQSQADTSTDSQRETQADSQDTVSLDEIKKVRSEAANLRKRLKDAESKLSQFETANQSEDEKRTQALKAAEERATAAESRYRAAIGRSAVTDAASKAGAISSRAVYALIRDDIEFDDDGEPQNIDALIAAAKKDEPSLFRAAAGSGDGGKGGTTTVTNPNDLLRSLMNK
jgi:DNA repair exonuclease SbcCD ATPase subunit